MYRTIVRRQVMRYFDEANRGNWAAIVDGFTEPFNYRFIGESPLGGTRTSKPKLRMWFERLYRLFPGAQFYPQAIVIEGPPWNTKAMTYVKIKMKKQLLPDEKQLYENEFMQLITIKWGKMVSIVTIEDTQRFVCALPAMAKAGYVDALGEKIEG
jgi:ketosteroid isomerase-like protein